MSGLLLLAVCWLHAHYVTRLFEDQIFLLSDCIGFFAILMGFGLLFGPNNLKLGEPLADYFQ